MEIARSFSDITLDQFGRWEASLLEDPDLNEPAQIQATYNLLPEQFINDFLAKGKYKQGEFVKIMSHAEEYFSKWESFSFSFSGVNVELSRGEDLMNETLGAVTEIKAIHNDVIARTIGAEDKAEKFKEFEGKEYEDLTDEQKQFLYDSDKELVREYKKVWVDILAWFVISKAGVQINDANRDLAKKVLNKKSASLIIPVLKFFFIQQVWPRAYRGVLSAFRSFATFMLYNRMNKDYTLPLKI